MSTKMLKEMLSQYADMVGSSTSEVGTGAEKELDAMERALAVGHRIVSGDLHVVSQVRLNEACALMRAAHEAELAATAEGEA